MMRKGLHALLKNLELTKWILGAVTNFKMKSNIYMFEAAQFLSNNNQRASTLVFFLCSIHCCEIGVVCKVIGRITT